MQEVDQSEALRRLRRRRATSPWLVLAIAAAAGFSQAWPLLAFLAAAFVLQLALARPLMAKAARDAAPAEARLPLAEGVAAEELYQDLMRHMRGWWAIHVRDCRGWRSLYEEPVAPAPLRLPFEFHVDGGDIVLRGSARPVRAARRRLVRRARLQIREAVAGP
jgi:hypothetical protein